MFQNGLSLVQSSSERLELINPAGQRLLLILPAVVILLSVLSTNRWDPSSLFLSGERVPLLLALGCLLAASYGEGWGFDRGQGLLERSQSLLFLKWRKRYRLAEVAQVRLRQFRRGDPRTAGAPPAAGEGKRPGRKAAETRLSPWAWKGRTVSILFLKLEDEKTLRLDTEVNSDPELIAEKAGRIASFCGVPLVRE